MALGTQNVSGTGVTLTGVGVTSTAGGTVNGGTGDILIDGQDGAISLGGALTTTSNTATAVQVIDASTAALGNITDYGTRYLIIGSASIVTAEARLVDLRSGAQLWSGRATASSEEGQNNQGGLAALLINAIAKYFSRTRMDCGIGIIAVCAICNITCWLRTS